MVQISWSSFTRRSAGANFALAMRSAMRLFLFFLVLILSIPVIMSRISQGALLNCTAFTSPSELSRENLDRKSYTIYNSVHLHDTFLERSTNFGHYIPCIYLYNGLKNIAGQL